MAPSSKEINRSYRELLEINRLITSSLDVDVVLSTVARQAVVLLRAEAAALLLTEGDVMRVVASHQLPAEARAVEMPLGAGVMGHLRALGRRSGLDGCVVVPLVLRGETIGVLAAYCHQRAPSNSEDEELLSALADQSAVAIDNARIFRQLELQKEVVQQSESRFRLAFDGAPIGMALVAFDGRFLRVNHVLCEMVGYSPEELTQLRFHDITHPDDVATDAAVAQRLWRGDIPRYDREKRYLRKDGSVVDILLSVSTMRDGEGAPLYYISQMEDITARKRAVEGLRRSEAQFRGLIERLPDGVFIQRQLRVAYANQALATLLGYPEPAALVGKPIAELYHADELQTVLERAAALERGTPAPPRELRMRRRDGALSYVESTAIRAHFEDQPVVLVIVRDLAERKRAESAREEAYRRLRVIIDLAPVGIVLSTDERHWQGNVRAEQLFGRRIDPSIDVSQYASEILDAGGRPLRLDQLPGTQALTTVQPLERVEMRLRQPNGHLVPILVNAAHIPGDEATPPGVVLVFEDITALKDLEQLRREWSAVVAHDLRQPLATIDLYAQVLTHQTGGDPPVQRRVMQIRRLTQRLGRMIQDLLDFSRLEARQLTLERRPVDLVELVRDATERIALEAPHRPIELEVNGHPAQAIVDADRIAQVMDNLLTNAVKYGDDGTPISVRVDVAGDHAMVTVTNRGPGIERDRLPHVFDRFQRVHEPSRSGVKGIGLGLYITHELIEAHGGHIVVESTPGESTTFRFTVPLRPQRAEVVEPEWNQRP